MVLGSQIKHSVHHGAEALVAGASGRWCQLTFPLSQNTKPQALQQNLQQLRGLAVLLEDPGFILSTHVEAHNHCIPSFRESDSLFWLSRVLHACGVHTFRQMLIHVNTVFFLKKKRPVL